MNKQNYLNIRKQFSFKIKNRFLFFHFLQDAILISSAILLISNFQNSLLKLLAIPLFSILMFRSFSLMHDASHGVVSKNKFLNDAVGILTGSLCLLPYEPWRQVHLEHHYWSGNINKDPVMALVRTFPNWNEKLKSSLGFMWKAWIPVLALLQYGVFWILSSTKFLKKPTSFKIMTSLLFPILGAVLICRALGYQQVLTLFVPSIALYLLAVEVVNFPHHVGLPYVDDDHHLPVWEQHVTARSCVYPTWLSKLIVLNFNYHIEHHMFPDAPWYYLNQLHQFIRADLKEHYNTDPQFGWIKENRIKSLSDLFKTEQRIQNQTRKPA